jgi:hypothetical protein
VSKRDVVQSHVEVLMARMLETDDLKINPCHEIPVIYRSTVYKVRVALSPQPAPHVEVFAVALDEVDPDPGLYEALNTINRKLSHARAFYAERKVIIAGELYGETLDLPELTCTCDEVAAVADHEGPRLAAVFGGHVARPNYAEEEE